MELRRLLTAAVSLFGLMLTSLASTARAQVSTASIVGTVVDSTRAAVSGATVTETQVETRVSRTVSGGEDGLFDIPLPPLCPYSLKISAAGFADFQQSGIVLTVGQIANIPVSLRPGNVSETVTVSANATMLNITGEEIPRACYF